MIRRHRRLFALGQGLLLALLLAAASPSAVTAHEEGLSYPWCPMDFDSLGDFTASGTVVFDTTALTYGGVAGGVDAGGVGVYCFGDFTVPAGTVVQGVGSRPLAILSRGTVLVLGTLHVDGTSGFFTSGRTTPYPVYPGGAGGGDGGLGKAQGSGPGGGFSSPQPPVSRDGGGGGGFGGPGGAGGETGDPTTAGAGGVSYGDLTVLLQGGSGGGGGAESGSGYPANNGGGGGGALYVAALVEVQVSGAISANGGNGTTSDTGASGAGSGGGVVLYAPVVDNLGTVRANGGAGGAGGCCGSGGGGGGGRILVMGVPTGTGAWSVSGGPTSSSGTPGAPGQAGVLSFEPDLFAPCGVTVACPDDVTLDDCPDTLDPEVYGMPVTSPDSVPVTMTSTDTVQPGCPHLVIRDWTITDEYGHEYTCTQTFTVNDSGAPEVTLSGLRSPLWPARGSLLPVAGPGSVVVADACDPDARPTRLRVYSDEDHGVAPFAPDAVLGEDALFLRSERAVVGDGRVYLLVIDAEDACGNEGTGCGTVVVPKTATVSGLAAVQAQAATARTYCGALPPPGWFLLLDAPLDDGEVPPPD